MKPEKNTVSAPYDISAEICASKPRITFAYDGLTEKQIRTAIRCLNRAFRKIVVINNETGAIVYDHYEDDDFYCPTETPTEAIDNCMLQINNIALNF